jgi:hypothetical protein
MPRRAAARRLLAPFSLPAIISPLPTYAYLIFFIFLAALFSFSLHDIFD